MGYTWAVGYTKHFLGSCRVPYWPQNAISTLQYPHQTAQFADQAVLDESPLVPMQKTVIVQCMLSVMLILFINHFHTWTNEGTSTGTPQ